MILYKKLFQIAVLFFFVTLLAGCIRKKSHTPTPDRQVRILVEGVECPVCARTAMRQIKQIPGIENLRFEAPHGDFEKGEFICNAPHNAPQFFTNLHMQLHKKCFGIKEVTATFIGRIMPRNIGRSLQYELPSWHQPFIIRGKQELIEGLFNSYVITPQPAMLKGRLVFDHQMQLYEFYPATT